MDFSTSDSGCGAVGGWPTRNRNWVGLDVANRENDYDDAEKRKNGPRVRQTSTFIVGHTRGRVAMMRTIREEMEGMKKVSRSSLHVGDLGAMTESFEESKQTGIGDYSLKK